MDDRLGAELVQQIRDFLAGEGAAVLAGEAGLVSGRGLQVAAAILMVAVIRADQASHLDEHRVLGRALGRLMGAGPEESLSVVREAEEVLARAEGLFPVVPKSRNGVQVGLYPDPLPQPEPSRHTCRSRASAESHLPLASTACAGIRQC